LAQATVFTVTQVNEFVKSLIESAPTLSHISIRGEISNFTNHIKTGHFYFSLKDEGGVLRCIMFRSAAQHLQFLPENGMKVILHGRISAYVRDGQYQMYAERMEPDGIGALYIAYEQLKKRLEAQGLFDAAHKKPLPKIPRAIGIITASTGAAVHDMIHVTGRRFPYAKLILFPSLVQGEGAPAQLIEGIQYFNRTGTVDVIIIGRGGGSMEELWAFNNEELAHAVYDSQIPVISAVGHETDFTICDFVADRRAPTPSAAAEIAVPSTAELQQKFTNIIGRLTQYTESRLQSYRAEIAHYAQSRALTSPKNLLDDRRAQLVHLETKLGAALKQKVMADRNTFVRYCAKLEALNPLSILSRGYSAVFTEENQVVHSVKQVKANDTVKLRVTDGTIYTKVQSTEQKGNK
jgi:exodeoxyribonuclease VII large subunit